MNQLFAKYENTDAELIALDLLVGNLPGYRAGMSAEDFDALVQAQRNPKPAGVSATALTGDGLYIAEKWGKDKRLHLYNLSVDARLDKANAWLRGIEAKGYTRVEAQIVVFAMLQAVNTEGSNNHWMNAFTEKMREQIVDKYAAFREKAYPLTERQFEAAVKAAW